MAARAVVGAPGRGTHWAFIQRAAIPVVLLGFATMAVGLAMRSGWSMFDLGVYLEAGRRFGAGLDPYGFSQPPIGALYRYSPEFAAMMAPLSALPADVVALGWRLFTIGALALSVRGLGWRGALILLNPLVVFDLAVANVATVMLAAMIAVIRWPSVRTVTAYALLCVVIPKPTLLPVLAWGLWTVRPAWRPVAVVLALGLVTALYPGFADGLLSGGHVLGMTQTLDFVPAPVVYAALATSVVLTIASVRWPVVLGVAAVLATPYYLDYGWVPLLLMLVPIDHHAGKRGDQVSVPHVATAGAAGAVKG